MIEAETKEEPTVKTSVNRRGSLTVVVLHVRVHVATRALVDITPVVARLATIQVRERHQSVHVRKADGLVEQDTVLFRREN